MGDVYRLVSDLLVKDTPADRRKIDLTTPLARVDSASQVRKRPKSKLPFGQKSSDCSSNTYAVTHKMNHQRESSEHRSSADSRPLSTRAFTVPGPDISVFQHYSTAEETGMPVFCRINTESRTEATGMKGFLRLCRERVASNNTMRDDVKRPLGSADIHLQTPKRRLTVPTTLLRLLVLACLFALSTAAICPGGCMCDDDNLVVSCIGANLDVIPIALNPSIQRIVLKENRIKIVDAAAFQFYGDLKNVDLSSNHLFTIPSGSFDAQKQLVELHLRHNKISALSEKTFQGLKSLTVLNLRDNYLESLKNGLFVSLSKLEELDLGKNRISKVEPGAFQKLGTLRVLHLDDNQLRTIPSPALAPLNALAELHIGWNAFSSLPDDAFKGLEQLTVLDITGAGLDDISDNAFRGLNALRTLELDGNKLREVPTKQLAVLPRLEELTLGQNFFTTLRSGAFQGLSKLKKLDISAAKLLTTVERGAFSDNANLETLVLNSNKRLTTMEDGSLAGLPNLRHLMLRDNAFTGFSESLVAWNELRRLDLSENPLVCDCSLLWLADVLVPRNSSPVLCAEPPESKGKPIKGMTPDELGCAFSDPRKQALLATLCAAGLALLTALALILYYRCRRRVRDALKDYKWKNRNPMSRKQPEYQKTSYEEEYIVRPTHPHHLSHPHQPQTHQIPTHHHSHHLQQQQLQQQQQQQQQHSQIAAGVKPIPVTEL